VRIICCVTQRLAAICLCDRVAKERGERPGITSGYQIYLESMISPCDTILTYCTPDLLLHSLNPPEYLILSSVTHIILDEIHERHKTMDVLMACLRDILFLFPNLNLVLMGAQLDCEKLEDYFACESSNVPVSVSL